jgi:RNA polymerase sigma-70 factor, ECF subfamily
VSALVESLAHTSARSQTSVISDDEKALIRGARAGSADAAEELVRRHWPDAYRAAYLVTGDAGEAEDVTQDAMIAALRAMNRFRIERPFRPWLHRIVVNRAIDAVRARQRRAAPASPVVDAAERPRLAGEEADAALKLAIRSLPLDQRAVVVLRFVLGYGPEEIGALLGIPRGTVGSRMRRGLDALRTELGAGK